MNLHHDRTRAYRMWDAQTNPTRHPDDIDRPSPAPPEIDKSQPDPDETDTQQEIDSPGSEHPSRTR